MLSADHALTLLAYDAWASDRHLDALDEALSAHPGAPGLEQAVALMSHLLRSQTHWLARIRRDPSARVDFWGADTIAQCRERRRVGTGALRALVEEGDLDRPVDYTNSKGLAFTSTVGEIVTHLVNHGTHHRAQISLLLRQAGVAPPPVDYIVYARS